MLDNITFYWLTNTGVSSGRLYAENKFGFFDPKGVTVPVAVSSSPRSSTRFRGNGQKRPIRNSSTTTSSTRAGTSPPGRSLSCSSPRSAPGSASSVDDRVFDRRAHTLPRRGDRVAQLRAARSRRAAPPRRPGELLDADLHQLAAPGAVRPRVVAGLPRRRVGRDWRPHPGVLVRARDRRREGSGEERAIDYPVAVDNEYEIWSAFANQYWPALYFIDADGVIRDQHFGEGRYEQSERVIQRLLGVERELVSVEGVGVEAEADWDHLHTPETYLGSGRGGGRSATRRVGRTRPTSSLMS